jgi:hypothetical protein
MMRFVAFQIMKLTQTRKKDLETRAFVERRMKMAGPDALLKSNLAGNIVDKLPGTIGKAVGAGAYSRRCFRKRN